MELNVPYVRQPTESVLCGAASAAMVLKFYGKRLSLQRVARELHIKSSRGVSNAHLACYFLSHGMDATVQAWPSGMADGLRSKNLLNGGIAVNILKLGIQDGTGKARVLCRELIALAKRGGGIILQPVTSDDLRGKLASGSLIIVSIDMKYFTNVSRKTGHYVVVYGITDCDSQVTQPYVYVHDSIRGPNKFISVRDILGVCNSWFSAVIYVKPKAA